MIYKIIHQKYFMFPKILATFVTSRYTIMNTRLKQFLAAENITQAQFADSINVVRASVSHVLSGRNNPSFEFIRSMMVQYPSLNIEWLMFGKGKMYKEVENRPTVVNDDILFPLDPEEYPSTVEEIPPHDDNDGNIRPTINLNTLIDTSKTTVNQRKVSKIIVLFDDGSFQEM